eukprot:2289475-Alexandrium_andersonii.AAC.1
MRRGLATALRIEVGLLQPLRAVRRGDGDVQELVLRHVLAAVPEWRLLLGGQQGLADRGRAVQVGDVLVVDGREDVVD